MASMRGNVPRHGERMSITRRIASALGYQKRDITNSGGFAMGGPGADYWYMPRSGRDAPSVDRALQASAVYACVALVGETVGSLPAFVYARDDSRPNAKRRDSKHPLSFLLHDEPNSYQDAFQFWEMMAWHLELRGNAYAEIQRDGYDRIVGIWPLHPDRMEPKWIDGRVVYIFRQKPGQEVIFDSSNILHLKLFGEGLKGKGRIEYAASTLNVTLSSEEFGERYFDGDAMPRIGLFTDQPLNDGAQKAIQDAWNRSYGGVEKSWRAAAFGNNLRPETLGIPLKDSQFLELRKYNAVDIARLFRVPPHMIGELERATFNNVEQLDIDFGKHSIRPRLVRIERACNRALLDASEKQRFYIEFNMEALLRGDMKSRFDAYATGIQWGIQSPNEARDLEGWNPREGGDGYLQPVNMIVSGQQQQPGTDGDSETPATKAAPQLRSKEKPREAVIRTWMPVVVDAFTRLRKRERREILAAANKHLAARDIRGLDEFTVWLREFATGHPETVATMLGPALGGMEKALADASALEAGGSTPQGVNDWIEGFLRSYYPRHAGESIRELELLMGTGGPEAVLEKIQERMEQWVDSAANAAADKVTQSDGAIAREVWKQMGVTKLVWNAGTCPICRQLDGRVIGIEESFVPQGQALYATDEQGNPIMNEDAEGYKSPIWAGSNVVHPPLHSGCTCSIGIG